MYKKDDLTYIEWLDNDKKYAIKTTQGFKDRVNKRLIRGYCSNIYTRFIGFEHNDLESVYDALYEMSDKLNINHW